MRTFCGLAALLGVLLMAALLSAQEKPDSKDAPIVPPKQGKRETIELFNGRDLAGWKGHEKYWSVQGDEIVGKNSDPIAVSTYLLTERNYSDFRLTFDFKLARSEMHSGIAMWGRLAPEQGDPYTYAGHLVMFPSNYGFYDLYGRRGIHANAAIAKPVGKQHDWNQMEILAQGNRIRYVLNGKLISDWREPLPERIKEAPIGLQLHSNKEPQEVRFKNLRLETFPEDKLITVATADAAANQEARMYRLYIGTYTGPKSKGIYQVDFDAATGKLGELHLAAETPNPSFLAIHPSGRHVYAVNELATYEGENSGSVSAFAIESGDGRLRHLNTQSSKGAAPCHIVLDKAGKYALIANYTGGSVGVLPIASDGKLSPLSSFVQHAGSSVTDRQKGPHGHSINLDAANRYAVAADLGLDQLLVYRFDSSSGKLTPNDPPFAKVAPGAGPRHFAFHPNGNNAYVINEITKTVTAFRYDAAAGRLSELQTISTVPAGTQGGSTAEVVVHPSGKFLYGSNRGHDSIAVFTIDPSTGQLTAAGHQKEGIQTPRNFTIEPHGRFLLVANQSGDSLLVFRIDQETGALSPTGQRVEVGAPVCIRMLPL